MFLECVGARGRSQHLSMPGPDQHPHPAHLVQQGTPCPPSPPHPIPELHVQQAGHVLRHPSPGAADDGHHAQGHAHAEQALHDGVDHGLWTGKPSA